LIPVLVAVLFYLDVMGKKKTDEATNNAPPPQSPAADAKDEVEDTPIVKKLKEIDDKYCAIEVEFEKEMEKLRQKYTKERQAPLLAERAGVLADASGCSDEDKQFGTPACKGFWLQAFQNEDAFAEMLEEWDEPVLQYLVDIKKSNLEDEFPDKGFKLEFIFKENEFFANDVLFVEFHTSYDPATYKPWKEDDCVEIKSSEIKWKPGKNVTVEVVTKKTKGGGAKKAKQKAKAKEEPRNSFFRMLFLNFKLGEPIPSSLKEMMMNMGDEVEDIDPDDEEQMSKMVLEQTHDVGYRIADGIIPYAVRYYTGEAGERDDDSDEGSESEEDDDDDDDDSEDEPEPKPKAKKKGQKNAAAGGEGQKAEECKQQ